MATVWVCECGKICPAFKSCHGMATKMWRNPDGSIEELASNKPYEEEKEHPIRDRLVEVLKVIGKTILSLIIFPLLVVYLLSIILPLIDWIIRGEDSLIYIITN